MREAAQPGLGNLGIHGGVVYIAPIVGLFPLLLHRASKSSRSRPRWLSVRLIRLVINLNRRVS